MFLVICEFCPSFNTQIFLCFTLKTLILKVLVFILKSEKRDAVFCCDSVLSLLGMWLFLKKFYVVFLSGWDTEPNSIFHRKKTVQKTACKPNINLVIADLIYWWSDVIHFSLHKTWKLMLSREEDLLLLLNREHKACLFSIFIVVKVQGALYIHSTVYFPLHARTMLRKAMLFMWYTKVREIFMPPKTPRGNNLL